MSDDPIEALTRIAADVKVVLDRMSASIDAYKTLNELIALAVDPKAVKRNLRSLHDARAQVSAAQVALSADRAAFDQHMATETAEIEPKRKAAVRIYEIAQAKLAEAERLKDVVEAEVRRLRELGIDPSPPRVPNGAAVHSDGWTAIEGTGLIREPDRSPPSPVDSDEPPPAQVRRGYNDSVDFPPGVTLTRQPDETEPPPAGARIRGRRNQPGA